MTTRPFNPPPGPTSSEPPRPGPPPWIVAAESDAPETRRWEDNTTDAPRTGLVRHYASGSVTGADVTGTALKGLRYAHKDNLGVAGLPLAAGSPVLAGHVSTLTSPLLAALETTGGTIIGAAQMAEFAMSPTGHNQWYGDGVNPLDKAYASGGSSSGSAIAVARGSCEVALGTDTGGSVRLPAAFCGLVGYKPTNGLFSEVGLLPLSPTLDTVGLIARDQRDLRATVDVWLDDPAATDPYRRRLLEDEHRQKGSSYAHLSLDDIAARCDAAVARGYASAVRAICGDQNGVVEVDDRALSDSSTLVVGVEAARTIGPVLGWRWELLGHQVRSRVLAGTTVPERMYLRALDERARALQHLLDVVLAGARFLLTPTSPILAPVASSGTDQASARARRDYLRASEYTRWVNYLGLPAVTIPLPSQGGPLVPALQVLGRPHDDLALLDAAAELAAAGVGGGA